MSERAERARMLELRRDIERDWGMVVRHLDTARSVDPSSGKPEAALVALSLDHAYQAFETMLVRIERALGLAERTGAFWHRSILADAARPIAGLRAEVIDHASEREWDELMRFRHFLRHAYTVELEAPRLTANVERLQRAVGRDDARIRSFLSALSSD